MLSHPRIYICVCVRLSWIAVKLVKTKKIYIINFVYLFANSTCPIEKWSQFVYRNIYSPNEITWQFHKRHIDLCLQTITTQTIGQFSMHLNANESSKREKKQKLHTKLINIASNASDGIHCYLHTFSLPVVLFSYLCRVHSKYINPEWHYANTTVFFFLPFQIFFSFVVVVFLFF